VVAAVVAFVVGAELVAVGSAIGAALIVIVAATSWAWGGRPPGSASWAPGSTSVNNPGAAVEHDYTREHGYES
jgi:hypothetical protein